MLVFLRFLRMARTLLSYLTFELYTQHYPCAAPMMTKVTTMTRCRLATFSFLLLVPMICSLNPDVTYRGDHLSRHQVQSTDGQQWHGSGSRTLKKKKHSKKAAQTIQDEVSGIRLIEEPKHYTQRSCKPSRSRKKATCQPSSYPTSSPSLSSAPSTMPSVSPSGFPTSSVSPSTSPSRSAVPSTSPSFEPSMMPSSTPTNFPSMMPSNTPSQSPSFSPSPAPSAAPSNSPMPSISPSQTPSQDPSESPSAAPTELVIVTNERENGALDSACFDDPPKPSGTIRSQDLAFIYNLYLTEEGNPTEAIQSIEMQLHYTMVNEFLTCNYDESNLFDVVTISSTPKDLISNATCDVSNDPTVAVDGTVCVVVNAGIQLFVFFSSINRQRQLQVTNASPEVLDAFGEFLQESMGNGDYAGDEHVVGVSFQGFTNIQEAPTTDGGIGGGAGPGGAGGGPPPITGGSVSGLQEGEDGTLNANGDGGVVVGSSILAVSAVCLVLVAALVLHKKNRPRDAYDKYLEDASIALSDDQDGGGAPTIPLSSSEGRIRIHVLTGSDHGDDSVHAEDVEYEKEAPSTPPPNTFKPIRVSPQHDVRKCVSATCPLCRDHRLEPTFISPHNLKAESELVRVELGPRKFDPDPSRFYNVADTVNL